jgi:chromosome segregation ATPase
MPETTPELAAAAKRIAALEADVANLRRGMVQQLTATGRLVQQALSLDTRHFAGRYLAGRQPNPQEEIGIAADILAAATTELDKRSGSAPVAGTAMTEVLRAELVAREGELAELRRESMAMQEEHAAIIAGLQTRADQAEERAAIAEQAAQNAGGSEDDRRSDRAEAVGLCSELLRTLQTTPAGGDDVQITMQVLQDALKDGSELGTVCQAAESAVVSWAEALVKDLAERKAATAGLEALRTTAGEWQKQATQLKAELDKVRAEGARAIADVKSTSERSGIIEREITKLQGERETLVRDVERLQVELGEQRRAAHEANMARARDREDTEAFRAKAKDEASQTVAQALADAAAASKLAEQAVAERDQLQGRLTNAQERIDRLDAERERSSAELTTLRRDVEALRTERDSAQAQAVQVQQQLATMQGGSERSAAEIAGLRKDLTTARAEAEAAGTRERGANERVERLQKERDNLVSERERALAEVGTLKRDLDALRGERDALQGKVTAAGKGAEALTLERDRAVGERERADIEISQLRKELEAARAATERVTGERDTMRSRIAAADGTAEAAMHERDQARSQVTNAAAERDRFRAALESAQEERSALMRAKDDQASQLTLRLTETSRQLGEMKQVHARLASENDRLGVELDALRKVAERGKTDAAEMARRAEALTLDRRRLEEAETRATESENRLADLERRAKTAIEERDAQLRLALGEAKRLVDDLAASKAAMEGERRRFADAVALLKQARSAVEDAKRQTATFDAVQAELARLKTGVPQA